MNIKIMDIHRAIKTILSDAYPNIDILSQGHYSLEDISDQIVFELIKEEYKEYAERKTLQDFIREYDAEAGTRKYTRALQYAQHYRNYDNDLIEQMTGIRVPEMEAQDVSGVNVFKGYRFTGHEYLGYKMQAECKLFEKLHGHQIDSSKKVKEAQFRILFDQYSKKIDELEPIMDNPESVIEKTFTFWGIEEHFFIDFMYQVTLEAEKVGFPEPIPVQRILDVIHIIPFLPKTSWCPRYFFAMNTMLMKRDMYCYDFFADDESTWNVKASVLLDTFRLKNTIMQSSALNHFIKLVHSCSAEDKANFIWDRYWIWDKRVEYEWPSERIKYFRKLHAAISREFPKPHIK